MLSSIYTITKDDRNATIVQAAANVITVTTDTITVAENVPIAKAAGIVPNATVQVAVPIALEVPSV